MTDNDYEKAEEKFGIIISFLIQLSGRVEMIADEIDNVNLKNAMQSFAVESTQYANELKCEMKIINLPISITPFNNLIEEITNANKTVMPQEKGKEILTFCETCEIFFHKMYNDFLQDFLPTLSVKNIINYQLLGIKSAFMRIKILNNLRFQQMSNH
jgi:hypothetical protein